MPQNTEDTNWEAFLEANGEDASNFISNLTQNTDAKVKQTFGYNNNVPIPGEKVDFNNALNIDENTALDNLITKSAIYKAKAEKTAAEKKQEEMRIRKQIIDMMVYNEDEAYYQKYHHIMDGKTKRRVKRLIEKNYDAGKYNYLKTTSNLNEP